MKHPKAPHEHTRMTLDRAPSSLCDQIVSLQQLATARKKAVKRHLAPHSHRHLSHVEISCVHHWISDFQFQSHESSYKMTEQMCPQRPRSPHSFLRASSPLSLYSSHSARGSCTPSDPTGQKKGTRREAFQHTPCRWQNSSDGPEDRQDAATEAGGQ